jgi:hypothetical protein
VTGFTRIVGAAEFLDDYCGSTGRPPIPPPWSFRSDVEGAASQLVERAFAKGAAH